MPFDLPSPAQDRLAAAAIYVRRAQVAQRFVVVFVVVPVLESLVADQIPAVVVEHPADEVPAPADHVEVGQVRLPQLMDPRGLAMELAVGRGQLELKPASS